jgi:Flp pilus assembly protein TadG
LAQRLHLFCGVHERFRFSAQGSVRETSMKLTWLGRAYRRTRDPKGTSLVEAAFITPLMLLLTFAMVDFSTMFYVYLSLENGVSQAARYGVTGNTMGVLSREDSIRTAMRNATPALTLNDAAFVFENFQGGSWAPGLGGPNDISRVTVNYTWTLMTPLIAQMFTNGQLQISVESAMKNEAFTP